MKITYTNESGTIICKAEQITRRSQMRAVKKAISTQAETLYQIDQYGRKSNLCNLLEGQKTKMFKSKAA